jgi:hypothetical protein
VDESPIAALLGDLDRLDVDAFVSRFARDGRLLTADGQRAEGLDAVRKLVGECLSELRSAKFRITAQWHQDDVWIAEVDADYELRDWLVLNAVPRAFILRDGPDGIADLHVYGAHERPFSDRPDPEAGTWVGERWIPPL